MPGKDESLDGGVDCGRESSGTSAVMLPRIVARIVEECNLGCPQLQRTSLTTMTARHNNTYIPIGLINVLGIALRNAFGWSGSRVVAKCISL